MISIFGDFHAVDKEPRHSAQVELIEWILKECGDNPVVFSGDFWDKPSVHWEKSYSKMLDVLLQFKEVHIIAGNHEIKGIRGNMLSALKGRWPNLHIYTEPEKVTIDGKSFLMLPYLYDVDKMVDDYSNMEEECDYVVCHVSPPGKNYGSEEVEFKNIKAKHFFYGHIHIAEDVSHKHSIIGVPNTTRAGEQHFEKRYFRIEGDNIESVPVPVFYDIKEIDFSEDAAKEDLNSLWEYIVVNAPSVKEATRKFRGVNVNKVVVIKDSVRPSESDGNMVGDSILDDFNEFLQTESVSEKVADVCRTFLSSV